jgi:predicted DNA-binding transcriptional regulator YafY
VVKSSKEMIINPYALTWQDDFYYLIGNYAKYDNLIHLRLDRISNAEILQTDARHFGEVSEYKEIFDVADYTNKLFGMYSGELTEVEFCCSKSITEQVLDRFSENIFIKSVTDTHFNFSVKAVASDALVTWVINYGENLKVVKPDSLREKVRQRAINVLKNYEESE